MADYFWDPLARQNREGDTLFLFDADEQKNIAPGSGGFCNNNGRSAAPIWQDVDVIVPGRFRAGITTPDTPTRGGDQYIWMPLEGLLPPDEWTIEFWVMCANAPAGTNLGSPVVFASAYQGGLTFTVTTGAVSLEYAHQQSDQGPVDVFVNAPLAGTGVDFGQWVNIAATLYEGVLRLYVNGVALADSGPTPIPAARIHGCDAVADGLRLLYNAPLFASLHLKLSDLRVSRYARVPGQSITRPSASTLTVSLAPTGEIVRRELLGGLHTLTTPRTEAIAAGSLFVLRTDKFLLATPIQAGGIPDATYPSPGISGRFCYDWQVVDRSLDYIVRLGCTPYISIDYTPQILGGAVAPYSGDRLATDRSYSSDDCPQVPSDLAAFQDIVRDLVHHCIVEKGYAIPYWGVWNEPEMPWFWGGTFRQYLDVYAACAAAVKSVSPGLKVGGPEVNWPYTGYFDALIEFCADNGVPLDFVSAHFYRGSVGDYAWFRAYIRHFAGTHGLTPIPELINGEGCWTLDDQPGSGQTPWNAISYYLNDWGAAWEATGLIEQQAARFVYSIYTFPVAEGTTFDFSGLMSSQHPWANFNAYRAWARLRSSIVATTFTGPASADVHTLASLDPATGALTILLARLRYAAGPDVPVAVQLPTGYRKDPMYHFVIDRRRSDFYDAGPNHQDLEIVERLSPDANDQVTVLMGTRAVHLLTFGVAVTPAADVTAQVRVTLGGFRYDGPTGRYLQSVTIKNASAGAVPAPVSLVLDGLPTGVTLTNALGATIVTAPMGSPYLTLGDPNVDLPPGASLTTVLNFSNPARVPIRYQARVLAANINR